MFDEFAGASRQHATKHALALAKIWLLALSVLDVDVERITLKKKLQIAVVLQDRVSSNLVQHAL